MLKIKGLKKKKKDKKGKHKEEELFDREELEQYRKEQQQRAEAGEQCEEGASSSEQSDEWKRFKALTAGVDDILKKTQGDLDRIKSTSYFQKKSVNKETEKKETVEKTVVQETKKRWVGFEDNAKQEESENPEKGPNSNLDEKAEAVPVKEQEPEKEEGEEEEEEEEEEYEEDEDIFDTSYVDVVASGEVKLAYIPDSPLDDKDSFDPFDTSIAEKVIKTDPSKRTLVSLGSAVEVLTGKIEKPTCVNVTKTRRPKRQDLLLESFDEAENTQDVSLSNVVEDTPAIKTLLDEDTDIIDDVIDLSINFAINLITPSTAVENKFKDNEQYLSNSLDEEFVPIEEVNNTTEVNKIEPDLNDDFDDEFVALAVESLLKDTGKTPDIDDNSGDTEGKKNKPERPPLQVTKDFIKEQDNSKDQFDEVYNECAPENDPFDTTFAENILPGKFELKLIEEEILIKEHEFPKPSVPAIIKNLPSVRVNELEFKDIRELNEHNFLDDDQVPLSFKHRDLLGGSTTDLSKLGQSPIEPKIHKEDEQLSYSDPFDTSVADNFVIPCKTELKFLENELLADVEKCSETVIDDDDFDPRAAESSVVLKPLTRPDQLPVGEKRASVPKVVAFNIENVTDQPDLLSVGYEESSKVTKPLTPYYADPSDIQNKPSFENESDPFDTSFVTSAPGKHELKLIESELVGDIVSKQDNTQPSKNSVLTKLENTSVKPPSYLPVSKICSSPEKLRPDILSEETVLTVKLHTPVVPKKLEDDIENINYTDPFDTSIVNNLLPGKAELKLIEYELIGTEDPTTSIKRSYTDPNFNPRDCELQYTHTEDNVDDDIVKDTVKENSLSPKPSQIEAVDDIDPFDTSCADKLVEDKATLKLLESELGSN